MAEKEWKNHGPPRMERLVDARSQLCQLEDLDQRLIKIKVVPKDTVTIQCLINKKLDSLGARRLRWETRISNCHSSKIILIQSNLKALLLEEQQETPPKAMVFEAIMEEPSRVLEPPQNHLNSSNSKTQSKQQKKKSESYERTEETNYRRITFLEI